MDQPTLPSPRLAPLPPEPSPELKAQFNATQKRMGFIPNSVLIMQRDPHARREPSRVLSAANRNPAATSTSS